jgi:hypothetical protein
MREDMALVREWRGELDEKLETQEVYALQKEQKMHNGMVAGSDDYTMGFCKETFQTKSVHKTIVKIMKWYMRQGILLWHETGTT